ncbi:MAG: hypothetical protein IPN69_20760 [Acidobacteria bacterium]|nr:hypothetical protein [Acidobacteriota bacterium]MBK8813141.1 hypothetical protein [Acidobacteriota bacterium]
MKNDNQTNSWIQVNCRARWDQLAESCDYFEDGVVRELSWTGGEYVDGNFQMIFAGSPVVWLLVQTQNAKAPAIEFRIEDVVEIQLDHRQEPEFNTVFGDDEILLELSGGGGSLIRGARLFYRIKDRPLLGETTLLSGSE